MSAEDLTAALRAAAPLSMADYMARVNAAYYARRDPLGRGGDFITAPEISQMFGEMLGVWLAARWLGDGSPHPCLLVELGPGRGTLMADALRATGRVPGFHAALRLHLIETSPALRAEQAKRLGAFAPVWHDQFATLPEGIPIYTVANEFFDALPVRQFVRTADGWQERYVTPPEANSPDWAIVLHRPDDPPLFPTLPEGSIWEDSPACQTVMQALATRLARDGGAAVVSDYGYAGPAAGETLQAVREHRPWPALRDPGTADLSAHVDFATLQNVAAAAGCQTQLIPQGAFLRLQGIETRLAQLLATARPDQKTDLAEGYRRLTAAEGMGMLFKVLVLAPADTAPLL